MAFGSFSCIGVSIIHPQSGNGLNYFERTSININKYKSNPILYWINSCFELICYIFMLSFFLDYIFLRVTFGMIGQLCLSLAFSSMYSWSLELMPTTIR